jgi:hypothetical protein
MINKNTLSKTSFVLAGVSVLIFGIIQKQGLTALGLFIFFCALAILLRANYKKTIKKEK